MQDFGFFKHHMLMAEAGEGEGGGSGGAAKPTTEPTTEPTQEPKKAEEPEVKMTQKDFDKAVERRLERARKDWQKELDDAKAKEGLSEAEKLKAEKADLEKQSAEKIKAATKKALNADIRAEAASQGVSKEKLELFLRIVDAEGLEANDNGDFDANEIKKAVENALKAVPEFKGQGSNIGGGSNPPVPPKPDELSELQGQLEKAREKGETMKIVSLTRRISALQNKK